MFTLDNIFSSFDLYLHLHTEKFTSLDIGQQLKIYSQIVARDFQPDEYMCEIWMEYIILIGINECEHRDKTYFLNKENQTTQSLSSISFLDNFIITEYGVMEVRDTFFILKMNFYKFINYCIRFLTFEYKCLCKEGQIYLDKEQNMVFNDKIKEYVDYVSHKDFENKHIILEIIKKFRNNEIDKIEEKYYVRIETIIKNLTKKSKDEKRNTGSILKENEMEINNKREKENNDNHIKRKEIQVIENNINFNENISLERKKFKIEDDKHQENEKKINNSDEDSFLKNSLNKISLEDDQIKENLATNKIKSKDYVKENQSISVNNQKTNQEIKKIEVGCIKLNSEVEDITDINKFKKYSKLKEINNFNVNDNDGLNIKKDENSDEELKYRKIGKKTYKKDSYKNKGGFKLESIYINDREYFIVKRIGKGGSGSVFLVIQQSNKGMPHNYYNDVTMYAMKEVKIVGDDSLKNIKKEIDILECFKETDGIIQIIDWEQKKDYMYILLEYGEYDLNSVMRVLPGVKNNLKEGVISNFPYNKILAIWEELLLIIQKVHSARIIHKDLKPGNFVFVNGRIKLIDFGISNRIPSDTTNVRDQSQAGTINYLAPEGAHCEDNKIGRSSDVWSLGVILYEMVYKKVPMHKYKTFLQKYDWLKSKKEIEYFYGNEDSVSKDKQATNSYNLIFLISIIKKCLVYEPKERATVEELLNMMDAHKRRTSFSKEEFVNLLKELGYTSQNQEILKKYFP
ncbi:serine/threonine-protein kinase mps1-like protein [Spraguea lophii 42_110]|uniref:Serine/threonine-protein kinase mps1-like protein n=1 Tax=Spraguea lophii (strain 42_110) TaxID=1358809 RepID=S7WE03_SPRLO|nr:serine/threonine-protein kinase mps1-like protein [Spraguea lophii 42_110]